MWDYTRYLERKMGFCDFFRRYRKSLRPYASARGEHGVITEAPADGKGHVISARLDLQRLQDAMD